jgi:hypothetical protein
MTVDRKDFFLSPEGHRPRQSARCRFAGSIILCLNLALARIAVADADAAPPAASASATDLVSQPLRPRRGELWAAATLEANLSHHRGGSRALAPDVAYGITDETSLSIAHSTRSIARIGSPAGLCLEVCDTRPDYTVNALAYHQLLRRSGLQLYAEGGVLLRDPDPWKPAALVGAAARWQRGRFAIDAAPYLQIGLANTDQGNRHRLVVPVRAWVQPTCRWALGLHTGVEGELAVFADAYHVPLAALITAAASSWLHVSLEAGFSSLFGPLNTASRRFASLSLELRL